MDEEGQRVLYVLPDFEPLLDKNQNIIGWIAIEGTKVNYPVMQSINGDSTYYLNHNFDQQEDKNGSLFLDDRCDVIKPTVNLIIYGHHMRSGAMFGDLDNYKSESFFKSHPYIIFNSLYETGTWAVMAAFESKAYTDADIGFRYYDFIDPQTEKEFRNGVNNMKSLSLYKVGIRVPRMAAMGTCCGFHGVNTLYCVRHVEKIWRDCPFDVHTELFSPCFEIAAHACALRAYNSESLRACGNEGVGPAPRRMPAAAHAA